MHDSSDLSTTDIIYPIFVECAAYTYNSFWETIFINMAYGKFPCHVTMTRKCIVYTSPTDTTTKTTIRITNKPAKEIYERIHELFVNNSTHIFSHNDISICTDNQVVYDNWSDIRKKGIKDLFVEVFVIEMKQKYNLSQQQSRQLLTFILLSIIMKTVCQHNVILENNRIKHIEGITFEDGTVHFSNDFDVSQEGNTEKSNNVNQSSCLQDVWNRHLVQLQKQRVMLY